ncbi:hypothetical protein IWZ00DRAFT_373909 [Phyllosticta capitalensis]|uniref:Biogenesis of lysosome-related organelles complex 1 subunit KXD1 n=1 Tax=Phyllosticta capitalensis TaxID=121624 RepID=A0ABR1YEG6_9PEZI
MTSTYYHHPNPSMPLAMPSKRSSPHHVPHAHHSAHAHAHAHHPYAVSPPETADTVTTGGPPSYDPTATGASSSYAGSEYEAGGPIGVGGGAGAGGSGGAAAAAARETASVDLLDYMGERLNGAFDVLGLERSVQMQCQTSGELNAKTRELLHLQALARQRLAATSRNFAEGMKAAKEVQRDLEWTQKRVSSINQRAARKYPTEYKMASERYPAPVDC